MPVAAINPHEALLADTHVADGAKIPHLGRDQRGGERFPRMRRDLSAEDGDGDGRVAHESDAAERHAWQHSNRVADRHSLPGLTA